MRLPNPTCKKCGDTMIGPEYQVYRCPCGWRTTVKAVGCPGAQAVTDDIGDGR